MARALERRGAPAPEDARGAGPGLDVAMAMQRLLDPALSDEEREALWRTIRENGRIDAVVAEFERRAELAPLDPRAHGELGVAYHQKMLTESGPEAGRWGARGAAAYERALVLDETDFDARFALAQHEYWAGMGEDAVRDFELLIEQQKDRAPEEKHAGAYLWLGNLYMDRGDAAAAKDLWSAGLALFPGHAALRERLDAFD